MKSRFIVFITLGLLFSCQDDDQFSDCQLLTVLELQDYENAGEQYQYEIKYFQDAIIKVLKSRIIDNTPHGFYYLDYQYNDAGKLSRANRRDLQDNVKVYFEFAYNDDQLIEFVSNNPDFDFREIRFISYNDQNRIDRVDYFYYKDGDVEPYDTFYMKLDYETSDLIVIRYFDAEDTFTGSVEVTTTTAFKEDPLSPLLIDRYYYTPLYLLENLPKDLTYKDEEGNIVHVTSYNYTIENNHIKSFTHDQGIRTDLFEFNYRCE